MAEKAYKFNFETYDKKHLNNLIKRVQEIQKMFDKAAREAARIGKASGFSDPDKPFHLSQFPAIEKQIDELIHQLHDSVVASVEEGDRNEWLLSAEKNDKFVDKIVASTAISAAQIAAWKEPHLSALEAFQKRKIEGMGLSSRVWKITDQFKQELEFALDIALGEGTSAADISREVRKLLNEPNKLFRRVRDKHGVLRLSKAAAAYHPGQGVYRSSYKNAMRLAATENNIAYRTADYDRWQTIPFVLGIEIKLSNNHPVYDICDELAGVYPKDFKWTGWHPFCRCIAVPKLPEMDDFMDYNAKVAMGEDVSGYRFQGEVKDVPRVFKSWVSDNQMRINRAKSKPYFIRDNSKYITRKSAKEIAKQRHSSRTEREINRVKTQWAGRLLSRYPDTWEQTYVGNTGGYVATQKDRILESQASRFEAKKFQKELQMCKVLADNGMKVEFLRGTHRSAMETFDITLDGVKVDLKQIVGGAGNIKKYTRKAIHKQGATAVVFELPSHDSAYYAALTQAKEQYGCTIYFYFADERMLKKI